MQDELLRWFAMTVFVYLIVAAVCGAGLASLVWWVFF